MDKFFFITRQDADYDEFRMQECLSNFNVRAVIEHLDPTMLLINELSKRLNE